ncbi:MAG: hypothetical protein JSS53_06910 [Proteobacteria bacterium]|nr:hypothetical protein [Pseudomonadota bacterium]
MNPESHWVVRYLRFLGQNDVAYLMIADMMQGGKSHTSPIIQQASVLIVAEVDSCSLDDPSDAPSLVGLGVERNVQRAFEQVKKSGQLANLPAEIQIEIDLKLDPNGHKRFVEQDSEETEDSEEEGFEEGNHSPGLGRK